MWRVIVVVLVMLVASTVMLLDASMHAPIHATGHTSVPAKYTYYAHAEDGSGAHWNPCKETIKVRANYDHLTVKQARVARAAVTQVLGEVSWQTGVHFSILPDTHVIPWMSENWWHDGVAGDADLLISFAPRGSSAVLDGNYAVTGNAVVAVDSATSHIHRSGMLVANDVFKTPKLLRPILRHEIGHSLGLGHSEDVTQLMGVGSGVQALQPGDLAGIASLRDRECIHVR